MKLFLVKPLLGIKEPPSVRGCREIILPPQFFDLKRPPTDAWTEWEQFNLASATER